MLVYVAPSMFRYTYAKIHIVIIAEAFRTLLAEMQYPGIRHCMITQYVNIHCAFQVSFRVFKGSIDCLIVVLEIIQVNAGRLS
jgi:hypothetical protein